MRKFISVFAITFSNSCKQVRLHFHDVMRVNEVHDLSNNLSLNSFSLRPRVDNSFEHCVPQPVHFCLDSFSESIDQRFIFADYLGSRTESACANKRIL